MFNRIEITSAGGLPQELSQEEFLEGVTAPRNKELIRVFKDVDLIENIGSGVLRILDAYDKSCFKFMEHFLRVTFKYRENPFKYENITPKDGAINGEINDGKKITTNEQKVLDCIIKNPNISQKEISEKTEIPYRTVQRLIASLKSKNIITRIGSNKLGYWNIFNNEQEKM